MIAALLLASAALAAPVEWVDLPAGRFVLGSGAPAEWGWPAKRPVVEMPAFRLARTPATFGQYGACINDGACTPAHTDDGLCWVPLEDGGWGRGRLPDAFRGRENPAVCLDRAQAAAFAAWAGGRLPSEAEYEYASRAGGGPRLYPWGDEPGDCRRAVMPDPKAGGEGCGRRATWPVCSKDGSEGFCDLAGNAWTWTADAWHRSYEARPPIAGRAWGDPTLAPPALKPRQDAKDGSSWGGNAANGVGRGGSWRMKPGLENAAYRFPLAPASAYSTGGVRPARDAKP